MTPTQSQPNSCSCYPTAKAFSALTRHYRGAAHFPRWGRRQAIRVQRTVPNWSRLSNSLGIGAFFDKVYSSACTGYEKPHPRSIGLALEYFEVEVAWMLGNSAKSDIGAADAAGIPSVLVVRDRPAPLVEAATVVLGSS